MSLVSESTGSSGTTMAITMSSGEIAGDQDEERPPDAD